jgi:hypothetical protein
MMYALDSFLFRNYTTVSVFAPCPGPGRDQDNRDTTRHHLPIHQQDLIDRTGLAIHLARAHVF